MQNNPEILSLNVQQLPTSTTMEKVRPFLSEEKT